MENSNITELTNYPNYAILNNSTLEETYSNSTAAELNLPYAACEILVAVSAVFGNGLVIIVFARERRLRRRTNYYIISLAAADLLVGLFAIPFAILASIGLPTNLHACLFTVSVLVVLCTISIFCLVAVSIDRYWAILYPMGYSRTVRTRTAIGIICVCWIAGTLVGFLPLLGWNAGEKSDEKCLFTEVMDYNYLVFLYFATIIFPALLIAAFYAHIYRVVVKQLQRIMTMNPGRKSENQTTGTMLRLLGAAQKREVKATQNLSRIVMFFIVCWFPLYTINCVKAFCPDCEVSSFLLNLCIILSHLNSVGNPLLYAYHLKDFRAALKNFICRLLFPKSDVKSSVISVINDRTSIAYNHNVNKMDRFIDGSRRKNVSLTAMKGVRVTVPQNNSPPVVFDEVAIFSPDSSPAHNRQEMDAFVTEDGSREVSPDISDHRRDEKSSNDDRSNSGIFAIVTPPSPASPSEIGHPLELRAYRPFVRILNSDSLSTESVFVIEADVNHCVSSRERLTSGERPIGQPDR